MEEGFKRGHDGVRKVAYGEAMCDTLIFRASRAPRFQGRESNSRSNLYGAEEDADEDIPCF